MTCIKTVGVAPKAVEPRPIFFAGFLVLAKLVSGRFEVHRSTYVDFFISLLPIRMVGVASKLVEPRPFVDTHDLKTMCTISTNSLKGREISFRPI